MNGINRRGMKVICVIEFEMTRPSGEPYRGNQPKLNGVYTVTDFVDNAGLIEHHDVEDLDPGITVAELPVLVDRRSRRLIGWPIIGFRPLDERKTDISTLVDAGTRTDLLTPDDKLAEFMRPFEAHPTEIEKACAQLAEALAREMIRRTVLPWLEHQL